MNDILKTYKEQFRENRHTLRRYTAFVLALAMITTLFVNWQLHGVGISMTAQYQCGEVEHAHTADCYDKVLICGYTEGQLENADEVAAAEAAAASAAQSSAEEEIMPLELEPQIEFVPHEHTDDCYTEVQTLTCMEEEHVHDDDCYDPEDGTLICEKFEHTHDESCYTTEYELTCGLEEGELVEQVVEPTQTAELVAMAVAEPVALEPVVDTVEPIYHHHTDACYEEVLVCPLPEHHHTVSCLSDTSADLETPEEWQAANADAVITGEWNEDLLSVAKTQLGYEQSEKNFEIDPADGVTLRYYSRYGQSYGNAYGEWDVMVLAYCLKYAEIPQSAIPQEASVLALRSSMSGMDWLLEEDGSAAQPGDIVIYNIISTSPAPWLWTAAPTVQSRIWTTCSAWIQSLKTAQSLRAPAFLRWMQPPVLTTAPAHRIPQPPPARRTLCLPPSPLTRRRSSPPKSRWTALTPLHPAP